MTATMLRELMTTAIAFQAITGREIDRQTVIDPSHLKDGEDGR
jgi:hypothetical protein